MTTLSVPAAQRRGSFIETWLLFADGWRRTALVALLIVGSSVFMAVGMPGGKDPVRFGVFMIVFMLPWTWALERQAGNRLAFLSLVPHPLPPKWLVLAPMCVIAVVAGAVTAAFGHRPPVAALAVLGCALWMVGSTRWLHRFGLWAIVASIFVLLAPVASYGAYRAGGWGAAAAVAMALGVGALLFQPRAYVGRPLPRPDAQQQEDAPVATLAPRTRRAISTDARVSELAAAWRFLNVTAETSPLFLFLLCLMGVLLGMFPAAGNASPNLLLGLIVILPKLVGRAYSPGTQEFLAAKPFGDRPRFIGGTVFPVLVILVGPVTAGCLVNRHLVDHGGAWGWIIGLKAPREDMIDYLRNVLGATFLPQKWPAGGLPVELWIRLRPLLYLDVLRTVLLTLTLVFALAPYISSGRKDRPPLSIALALVAFAAVMRLAMTWTRSVPVPPVWFAALLAAIAIADFWRRARAVLAPARVRGAP